MNDYQPNEYYWYSLAKCADAALDYAISLEENGHERMAELYFERAVDKEHLSLLLFEDEAERLV